MLLFLKVLWGYWECDLTFGDASYYFQKAVFWQESGPVDIVWSARQSKKNFWIRLSCQNGVAGQYIAFFIRSLENDGN